MAEAGHPTRFFVLYRMPPGCTLRSAGDFATLEEAGRFATRLRAQLPGYPVIVVLARDPAGAIMKASSRGWTTTEIGLG